MIKSSNGLFDMVIHSLAPVSKYEHFLFYIIDVINVIFAFKVACVFNLKLFFMDSFYYNFIIPIK